jgi:uncharacterized membrane protein YbhN (UPF0104 family)
VGRAIVPLSRSNAGTSRALSAWAQVLGGTAVLAALVWRLGSGPFLGGARTIDAWSLVAASGIAALTTVCCAWRWTLVARGLGLALPLRAAVGAYYRSQFLNTMLPGGVLGDVHRGVRHGRDAGDLGRGLRAVVCERCAGQVVQVVLTVVMLLVMPSPVRSSLLSVSTAFVVAAFVVILAGRALPRGGASRMAQAVRAAGADVRDGLLGRRAWPGVLLTSTVSVAGHTAAFLIAARTAGSTVSAAQMLPPALLVLWASGLPTNLGGWGPREGMAAWAFGTAGLGVDHGVATAVVYGVMMTVATLPGAVLLGAAWLGRAHTARTAQLDPGVEGGSRSRAGTSPTLAEVR